MTTVISHLSALRAIRRARRAYSALPWDVIDDEQQTQSLEGCVPNKDAIDFAALAILDAWSEDDSECLDLFVAGGNNRRPDGRLLQHTITAPLPQGAIMHIEADIYVTSPAMTAMLCSKNESVAKTLMLLMELLGTYSLPPEATYPIAYDDTWPKANGFEAMDGLDCQGDQPTPEKQAETRYEQAHYKCEPATTIEELEAVARFAKSSSYASFRTAVKLARAGSASPAESLMFAVLGAPMRFGGFGCCSLPMGAYCSTIVSISTPLRSTCPQASPTPSATYIARPLESTTNTTELDMSFKTPASTMAIVTMALKPWVSTSWLSIVTK